MSTSNPSSISARLLLRPWRDTDLSAFAAMNTDPRVMEHLPEVLDRRESDAAAQRLRNHFRLHGFGKWVVEVRGVDGLIGVVGLAVVDFEASFTPCVEVGWRLRHEHWGHGYATESARTAIAFGFEELDLKEIVSFTVPMNERSRRVMVRLGMTHSASEDFEHPSLPSGHPLRPHVLYRLSRQAWSCSNRLRRTGRAT